MQAVNGSVRITETAVDDFIRGGKGSDSGELATAMLAQLKRIADSLSDGHDQQPDKINGFVPQAGLPRPKRKSPYMDSEEAAAYLGITVKSLYGQVERGHIRPLRGPRRQYRFTVEMLDEYLRN